MTLDDWRQAGRRHPWAGHSIFYRDEGRGPAVLCLHGFPTASWDWHRLWARLAAAHRAVAPDLLGFGFSDKPRPHRYSILEQASICESLLAALGIDEAIVLAHDYGDTVAQELLARHEERRGGGLRLRGVCLLNGGLFPEAHRALPVQRLVASPLGPLLVRLSTPGRFRASLASVFGPHTQPTRAELDDFARLVGHGDGGKITHLLLGYLDERRRHRARWVGALERTAVPLRLVDGALDPVSGRHMAERYRELVPAPDVVLLDDVGHYPQVEAPDAVWAAFADFAARRVQPS